LGCAAHEAPEQRHEPLWGAAGGAPFTSATIRAAQIEPIRARAVVNDWAAANPALAAPGLVGAPLHWLDQWPWPAADAALPECDPELAPTGPVDRGLSCRVPTAECGLGEEGTCDVDVHCNDAGLPTMRRWSGDLYCEGTDTWRWDDAGRPLGYHSEDDFTDRFHTVACQYDAQGRLRSASEAQGGAQGDADHFDCTAGRAWYDRAGQIVALTVVVGPAGPDAQCRTDGWFDTLRDTVWRYGPGERVNQVVVTHEGDDNEVGEVQRRRFLGRPDAEGRYGFQIIDEAGQVSARTCMLE
jgi:YD repeat-containing protein